MNWTLVLQWGALLVIILGFAFFGWNGLLKGTIELLKEQNTELKNSYLGQQTELHELLAKIAIQEGKISVLESLPLQAIAEALRVIGETNLKVLATLNQSASLLAVDTERVRTATEKVAADLKKDCI